MSQRKTHFGYQLVDWEDKEKKVKEVFSSVATRYDLMNNLMSFFIHHLWKKFTVELSLVRAGDVVLDLAGGTGDLARRLSRKIGVKGQLILADINASMLEVGRDRLINSGFYKNILFVQTNAECLAFKTNSINCIVMGFGLRNVTDKEKALRSMFRICRPGGKIMILEFSHPTLPGLEHFYHWYLFNILPKMGALVANDAASYQYLAESIKMHPSQEELAVLIEQAGFEDCRYHNLTGGIVALHIAYKY